MRHLRSSWIGYLKLRSFLKKNMNVKFLSLAVVAAFAVTGCGGGGGSDSKPANDSGIVQQPVQPPVQNTTGNSGSVDAKFVAGAAPRFLLTGVNIQAGGVASPVTQATDGAVTTIGGYSLTGTPMATQEISGNASFAQGRWSVGTVTTPNGADKPMAGNDFYSYHYVVFNSLPALPTSGTMTCDAGKFTKPNNLGGGTFITQSNSYGTATGTAGITFDGSGGNVNLVITASGDGVTGTGNFSGTVRSTSSSYIAGGLGGLGNGAMVSVGDAGNGAVNILAIYSVVLANKNTYRGVATFTCK